MIQDRIFCLKDFEVSLHQTFKVFVSATVLGQEFIHIFCRSLQSSSILKEKARSHVVCWTYTALGQEETKYVA